MKTEDVPSPAPTAPRREAGESRRILADLVSLDERLRERDAAWSALVLRLGALRREIAVTATRAARRRPPAAPSDEGGPPEAAEPTPLQARVPVLMQEFEAALRDTEAQRVALHVEREELRSRRQGLLDRLPAALAFTYRSLVDAGRLPAVAVVASGACASCGSPLPPAVAEALVRDAVAVCAGCERLLLP